MPAAAPAAIALSGRAVSAAPSTDGRQIQVERGGVAIAICARRMSRAPAARILSGVVPSSRENRAARARACRRLFTWSPPLDSAARRIMPLVSGEASRFVTVLPPADRP